MDFVFKISWQTKRWMEENIMKKIKAAVSIIFAVTTFCCCLVVYRAQKK